jgi:hypothetical protein
MLIYFSSFSSNTDIPTSATAPGRSRPICTPSRGEPHLSLFIQNNNNN